MSKQIINITDITGYLFCPRKIYLKLIEKIREPPTQPMIKGMLKHKVFDIFNKNEIIIVSSIKEKISKTQIKQIYLDNISKITNEVFNNYRNMAESFGIAYPDLLKSILKLMNREIDLRAESIQSGLNQNFLGKELWRNLKPKFLTEFEILSEELGLKGRIDRIEIGETILPYEIKTREEIYESDKIQLAAYSLLLEKEFNKPVSKGIIEVESKSEEIFITDELKNQVLEIAEKIRNLKSGDFPSSFAKCENCRLKDICYE